MRLVFLDSGTLSMLAHPKGRPRHLACRQWVRSLLASGAAVFIPEVCDYELRRELIRTGASAGLRRLDLLQGSLDYAPITTDVIRRAAELWAGARRSGRPTASPDALDADCILAAQALLAAGPGDAVTVATDNVGHLSRFVAAEPWEQITP